MQPRAFVVMPYGKKRLDEVPSQFRKFDETCVDTEIDFDAVYKNLLELALIQAGCEPVRADSETAAGDIRTDMFFELVTADIVVADISMANPNVFYELGVRHGVCSHGVLVVHNSLLSSRPFDVSVDRTFKYDGSLFRCAGNSAADQTDRLKRAVADLAETLRRALEGERQTTGSPVYEHLPGLVQVNWDKIETSRAKYFGQLNDDWLDLVKEAQANGYAGDIQTLAEDAPTLFHRNMILYQAALALIDLCRYRAAEVELRKLVQQDPSDLEARLQLGLVLAQQGKSGQAETHLRKILSEYEGEPHAGDLLGQVYRHLWHLAWIRPIETRKQNAVISVGQAAQAVQSFLQAQQLDPRAYFAGFNALILYTLVNDLFRREGVEAPEVWREIPSPKMMELATVVQFCAENAQENARKKGDFVEQFLATTTLSGLALIRNEPELALNGIKEACSISKATFFQLQTFEQRLSLLDQLDFRPDFVKAALGIVGAALRQKRSTVCEYKRVFLWAGYPLDKPCDAPRFPESSIDDVKQQIAQALEDWKITEGDLAICEGVREGDILFAEACLARKAQVRLMLLDLQDTGEEQILWPFQSEEWERRFKGLRSAGAELWFHSTHLGPYHTENARDQQSLLRRHKNWIINTAEFEAEPTSASDSDADANAPTKLYGLFLWNGEAGDGLTNPSFFVGRVNKSDDYQGQYKIIRAIPADTAKATGGAE